MMGLTLRWYGGVQWSILADDDGRQKDIEWLMVTKKGLSLWRQFGLHSNAQEGGLAAATAAAAAVLRLRKCA